MKKPLVIIKLGGSVITDKSIRRGVFRKAVVRRLAKEIVEAKKKKNFDLILVHGAGAYAHYLTYKYKLSAGFLGTKSAFGFVHVKKELFKLNNLVWSEFLTLGMPVCTVQPSAVVFTDNGKIKRFNTEFIELLLKLGIVPVLMGDDTIDESRGIAVLSGDRILLYLGRKFKANKLIFVSDVDGVYNKNPKIYKDAKLIRRIDSENFKRVLESMTSFNKYDTTGEMRGKLLAMKEELKRFKVQVVGGFAKSSLADALIGREVGTTIYC